MSPGARALPRTSVPAAAAFERAGIRTLGDLTRWTERTRALTDVADVRSAPLAKRVKRDAEELTARFGMDPQDAIGEGRGPDRLAPYPREWSEKR